MLKMAIRSLNTGLYFDKGKWAEDPKVAQHFKTASEIETVVADYRLENVERVILDPDYRIRGGFIIRAKD